ncbi:MAG: dienelactone hydrolase family protein [Clostridia bacterium]|nr:dienelactone hydrolase family protein [Clostridia bacterium]
MKKTMKKLAAVLLAVMMAATALALPASAATVQTTGKNNALYPVTDPVVSMGYLLSEEFANVLNVLAGMSENWSSKDGTCYETLSYGKRGRQVYDLYVPKGLSKKKPQGVVLFIHGGTWSMGGKSNMSAPARKFAKAGYITATMSYDLLSDDGSAVSQALGTDVIAHGTGSKNNATVYDMVDDVELCVKAINKKLIALGYKAKGLCVSGVSAGSHIALMFAYGRPEQSAIPVKCVFTLTAPVAFYKGTFDNYTDEEVAGYASQISGKKLTGKDIANPSKAKRKILDSISPVSFINKKTVPTFFAYAGKDKTIGTNQYATIEPYLVKYGVRHKVLWFPNSDHTLLNDPGVMQKYITKSEQWLAKYMK